MQNKCQIQLVPTLVRGPLTHRRQWRCARPALESGSVADGRDLSQWRPIAVWPQAKRDGLKSPVSSFMLSSIVNINYNQSKMAQQHPLIPLSVEETNLARDVIRAAHPQNILKFRVIFLEEPAKALLAPYLDLEHAGKVTSTTPRPPRQARVHFDTAHGGKPPQSHEAVVDLAL